MNAGTNPRRNYVGFRVPREFPEHPSGVPQCLVTTCGKTLASLTLRLFDCYCCCCNNIWYRLLYLVQTPHIYHLSSPLKEVHAKKLIDIGNGIFTVEYLQGKGRKSCCGDNAAAHLSFCSICLRSISFFPFTKRHFFFLHIGGVIIYKLHPYIA